MYVGLQCIQVARPSHMLCSSIKVPGCPLAHPYLFAGLHQVAGTMRRSGAFAHERDYHQLLNELQRLEERQNARLAGRSKRQRSEHLERLKYWLALPNSYYDDTDWS